MHFNSPNYFCITLALTLMPAKSGATCNMLEAANENRTNHIMIRHIHRLPRRNVARLYCPALLVTSLKRPVLARRAHVSATLLHVRPPGLGRTIDIRRGFCAGHVGESVCWKCGQQARDGSLFCRDAGCGSILDPGKGC